MSEPNRSAEDVFTEALDIGPEDERRAFILDRCDGDEALLTRVLDLVDGYERAHEILGRVKSGTSLSLESISSALEDSLPTGPEVGEHIGEYRLVERIGEGGFGVVYQAEQEEPVFPFGVLIIVELDGEIVVEDRPSVLEGDPVLLEILLGLDGIPLESQLAHRW